MTRTWVESRLVRIPPSAGVPAALREAVQTRRPRDNAVIARVARRAPDALVAGAVHHGVAGYLWSALAQLDDPEVQRAMRAAGLSNVQKAQFARQVRLGAELVQIGRVLDQEGIEWAALKGPALAESVHGRPDLRTSVDLDLLVSPHQLLGAIGSLQAYGCVLLERNWPALISALPGELHMRSTAGTPLDVHWHVIHEAGARSRAAVATDDLLGRTREVEVAGGAVPTLDAVDTLIHQCLHAALSGGDRLIWLVDIDRSLVFAPMDQVVRRAQAMRIGPAVELMLRRARNLLCSPVDDEQLRSLVPERSWRLVSAVSAAAPPVHRARGGGSFARLVARATRADARSSGGEVLRRSREWLRSGTSVLSGHSIDWWDEGNPDSMMFDAREPDGLARFARHVSAESASRGDRLR